MTESMTTAEYSSQYCAENLLDADEEKRLAYLILFGRRASTQIKYSSNDRVKIAELRRAEYLGEKAKEEFIHRNMRLVLNAAKKVCKDDFNSTLEIVGEGNLILTKLVEAYDVTKGLKFSTYAYKVLLQEMEEYRKKIQSSIYMPRKIASDLVKVNNVIKKMQENDVPLDFSNFLEYVEGDDLEYLQETFERVMVYKNIFVENIDDEFDIEDNAINVQAREEGKQLSFFIAEMFEVLTKVEIRVIKLSHGFEEAVKTENQIAIELSMSRSQVKKIFRTAVAKLKKATSEKYSEGDMDYD